MSDNVIRFEFGTSGGGGGGGGSSGGSGGGGSGKGGSIFDPEYAARKQAEREDQARQIRDSYNSMVSARMKAADNLESRMRALDVSREVSRMAGPGALFRRLAGGEQDNPLGTGYLAATSLHGVATKAGELGIPGSSAIGNIASAGATGGPYAAAAAAGFETIKAAASALTDQIKSAQNNAFQYSPVAAGAQARSDARDMLYNVREAKEVGEAVARQADAEADIRNILRDALLPIKAFVIDKLAGFTEFIRDAMVALQEIVKTLAEVARDAFGDGKMADIPKLLKDLPNRVRDEIKKLDDARKGAGDDEFLIAFLGQVVPNADKKVDIAQRKAQPGIPAFGFGM